MRIVCRSSLTLRAVLVLLVLLALAGAVGPPPVGAAEESGVSDRQASYRPPVAAMVIDHFREPAGPYGPGNRGLEYETAQWQPVGSIGAGVVVFAGQVAGRLVVSIEHPDGLRSSLVGLASVAVSVGQRVWAGTVVGRAGTRLHLGVRRGDVYLDPAAIVAVRRSARLVPWPTAPR